MKCCSIIKHFHWSIFNFLRDLWVISLLLVTAKLLQLNYDNDLLSWNQSRTCFIFIFFSFEGSKYIIICSPFTSSLLKMGQQKTLTRHISVMKTINITVIVSALNSWSSLIFLLFFNSHCLLPGYNTVGKAQGFQRNLVAARVPSAS